MSFITYTATERIIGTHTLNNSYNKDFESRVLNPFSDVDRIVVKSLSKKEEVSYIGEEDFWSIVVTNIDVADLPEWEEIFFSLIDGSNCTFDPYGYFAAQVSPGTYVLVTNSFSPRRVAIDTFDIPLTFKKEI